MLLNSFGDNISTDSVRFECAKSVFEAIIDLQLDGLWLADAEDALEYLEDVFPVHSFSGIPPVHGTFWKTLMTS